MGKGANKQLLSNSGTAQTVNKNLLTRSNDIYGTIDPVLKEQATNPQGYSPADLSAMNTASQQSLGGSVAGITGESNLATARTRNAGGYQGAIGTGSRTAMKDLSQNAVQIQADNARVKQAQQQSALSALEQLYGVNEGTALGYLNSSNSALSAENEGRKTQIDDFWKQVNGIQKLAGSAATAVTGEG